jgi:hypothetical protein
MFRFYRIGLTSVNEKATARDGKIYSTVDNALISFRTCSMVT